MMVDRVRALLASTGVVLVVGAIAVGVASPSAVAETSDSSSVTKSGSGRFSDLRVTINQTKNLVNQSVEITWSGGAPTLPTTGGYAVNYLQIMQCWGDNPNGPPREQCQFGGIGTVDSAGANTGSRQITMPPSVVDTGEKEYPGPSGQPNVYVPFWAVDGTKVDTARNQFFDANTTNEIPYGRTRSGGSGQAFMEMQTGLEAPGLGCGQVQREQTQPHNCWLVIVPRDTREVDGQIAGPGEVLPRIISSPLTQTNWDDRIVIPLQFEQLGAACPIGRAERSTIGTEMVSEAVGRWQPELCAGGNQNFSYSRVSDEAARRVLTSATPALTFMTRGLPAETRTASTPVYAPVTVSGITVAYNVESQSSAVAPPDIQRDDGKRITSLKLNPRLLLKLLSQTYRFDATSGNALPGNPFDLSRDKEFVELNPAFKPLEFRGIKGILLPIGRSDVINGVWDYINGDADARAFLSGKPDPNGVRINPAYKNMDITSLVDYPRRDLACEQIRPDYQVKLCTLDKIPFADSMFGASRAASRGDTLSRQTYNANATPPQFGRDPLQLAGSRSVLAIVDTASAARFGLDTASLLNVAGRYVEPTTSSMAAGLAGMTTDPATGLLQTNTRVKGAAAYPLTSVGYAATVPESLTKDEGRDYVRLIRFVSGDGQTLGFQPGRLPAGYLPLTASLRNQAGKAASAIAARAGTTPAPSPSESTTRPGSSGGDYSGIGTTPSVQPSATGASPAPSTTSVPTIQIAAARATPGEPIGSGRFAVVAALVLGVAALFAAAVMPMAARRLGR